MNDNETVYVIQGTNKHKTSYHDDTDACQSSKVAEQFEECLFKKPSLVGWIGASGVPVRSITVAQTSVIRQHSSKRLSE